MSGDTRTWTLRVPINHPQRSFSEDLQDTGSRARFLIRDRDSKFTDAFDAVLSDAGLEVVKCRVRMPSRYTCSSPLWCT
jgi:hypothetical protein